jgi:hypothetical protein
MADVGRHGDAAEEFFGGHREKVSDWRIIASGEWRVWAAVSRRGDVVRALKIAGVDGWC